MNNFTKSLIAGSIGLLVTGCSSTIPIENLDPKESKVPSWYLEPGKDTSETIFASATAVSDRMEFSVAKASHAARVILADKVAATASQTIKQFNSDHAKGGTSRSSQMTEQVTKSQYTDINISGYRILEKMIYRENDMYRTYVLVSLSKSDMTKSTPSEMTSEDLDRAKTVLGTIQ